LFGISKHGRLAVVTLIEAAANLALSILLVRPYGIIGDALGTAIPLLCTYILFMPSHLCSRLEIRVSTFLRQAYFLPLMVCAPMVVVLLLMRKWFAAHTYRQLIPQLLAGGLVYGLCLAWAHFTDRALHVGDLGPPAERLTSDLPMMTPAIESHQEDV
jgi:O-antigen/teichoic acid export membrane protein